MKKNHKIWIIIAVIIIIAVLFLIVPFIALLILNTSKTETTIRETEIMEFADNSEEMIHTENPEENITSDNPESSDLYVETIIWDDLDGNGVEEYLVIENGSTDRIYGSLTFYFNDVPIYRYEEDIQIAAVDSIEFVDLDNDDEKEIFVSFQPMVNSSPLEEWFALKKVGDEWKLMEMHHNNDNMCDNAFPISVTLGEADWEFIITCAGLDEEISFDATEYYAWKQREKEEFGGISYDAFMNGNFQPGDVVGGPAAWGIWNIELTSLDGQDCLVAEHSLQGPGGIQDTYGTAYIYFDFNADSKIELLHMDFKCTEIN